MGKTILCEKVIGFDNIVEISVDFNESVQISGAIAAQGRASLTGDVTNPQRRHWRKLMGK